MQVRMSVMSKAEIDSEEKLNKKMAAVAAQTQDPNNRKRKCNSNGKGSKKKKSKSEFKLDANEHFEESCWIKRHKCAWQREDGSNDPNEKENQK